MKEQIKRSRIFFRPTNKANNQQRHVKFFLTFAATLLFAALTTSQATAEMAVSRHAFADDIIAREPSGAADVFSDDADEVYFFTQLVDIGPAVEIYHIWFHEGVETARVPLMVEGSSWRTWSKKRMQKHLKGKWSVEVRTADDKVLLSASFTVK